MKRELVRSCKQDIDLSITLTPLQIGAAEDPMEPPASSSQPVNPTPQLPYLTVPYLTTSMLSAL